MLVAARDIAPWELVVSDTALVTVPLDRPACLGCLAPLPTRPAPCPGCGWPVCNAQCAVAPEHAVECELFRAAGAAPDLRGRPARHWLYGAVGDNIGILL